MTSRIDCDQNIIYCNVIDESRISQLIKICIFLFLGIFAGCFIYGVLGLFFLFIAGNGIYKCIANKKKYLIVSNEYFIYSSGGIWLHLPVKSLTLILEDLNDDRGKFFVFWENGSLCVDSDLLQNLSINIRHIIDGVGMLGVTTDSVTSSNAAIYSYLYNVKKREALVSKDCFYYNFVRGEIRVPLKRVKLVVNDLPDSKQKVFFVWNHGYVCLNKNLNLGENTADCLVSKLQTYGCALESINSQNIDNITRMQILSDLNLEPQGEILKSK